ncbi:unnamed protein product [Periconia digitata]|uniref:Uncharacterized protein n=1 Tax=Periconia digitata TaxID=1303443 RepID=A0A9W4U4L8_9PLEO|nr:unnamed protein product [Periconia digitata]
MEGGSFTSFPRLCAERYDGPNIINAKGRIQSYTKMIVSPQIFPAISSLRPFCLLLVLGLRCSPYQPHFFIARPELNMLEATVPPAQHRPLK